MINAALLAGLMMFDSESCNDNPFKSFPSSPGLGQGCSVSPVFERGSALAAQALKMSYDSQYADS